jgi:hypothetical protein
MPQQSRGFAMMESCRFFLNLSNHAESVFADPAIPAIVEADLGPLADFITHLHC